MMRLLALLPALLLALTLPAPAASAQDSALNRGRLRFGAGGRLVPGFGAVTPGFEAGYFLSPELELHLTVLVDDRDVTGVVNDLAPRGSDLQTPELVLARIFGTVERARLRTEMVAVQARFFTTETFHMDAGLGFRELTADVDDAPPSGTDRYRIEATSPFLPYVGIGHQWLWAEGWYVAVDWAGLYLGPVVHLAHSQRYRIKDGDPHTRSVQEARARRAAEAFSQANSLVVVNVAVGLML